jgi:hypothetical protein
MSELLELRAVVRAAPETVAEILLDVRPGGRSPFMVDGVEASGVTVDRAARSVTQEGAWWYRGVTSVEPDPEGSRVVHRIFNVAERHGWAARFVSRGPVNAAPAEFAERIRRLSELLGVESRVLD